MQRTEQQRGSNVSSFVINTVFNIVY